MIPIRYEVDWDRDKFHFDDVNFPHHKETFNILCQCLVSSANSVLTVCQNVIILLLNLAGKA